MKKILPSIIFILFSLAIFAQVPTITSFTPLSGPVGTSVKITGSNFSTTPLNNVVFFGATRATVTAATATQLTVTVPIGASSSAVTVTTAKLTAYSQNAFIVTFSGAGPFAPTAFDQEVDIPIAIYPGATKAKDIDGDGKPDIIVANSNGTTMSVFRNISTTPGVINASSLAAKIDFTVGSNPGDFYMDDIDGDGKPDIVTVSNYQNSVNVLRNTSTIGNISFAANVQFATGNRVIGIKVVDINGDGKPDIITTNNSDNTFSVLLNTSTGTTISFAPKVDIATGVTPGNIVAADFNGDGKTDLAITSLVATYGHAQISVYTNTSSGSTISFAPKINFLTNNASSVAAGDIDGDGKPDIIYSDQSVVSVLRNISSGGNVIFDSKVDVVSTYANGAVLLADADGDGRLDVLTGTSSGSGTMVFRNASTVGSIAFDSPVTYSITTATDFADVDGDGKLDIIGSYSSSPANLVLARNKINEPAVNLIGPETAVTGTPISITGLNFTGTTAVSFGGAAASSFTVNSPTSITAIVGTGATGIVTVKNAYGTGSGPNFVYGTPPPAISSFSPVLGPIGTSVTINGKNFNTIAANNIVYFGVARATVTSATATQLVVTVPVGADYQPITVTTNSLTAYSAKPFDVTFTGGGPFSANSFNQRLDFAVPSYPTSLFVADLDGDGKTDIVAYNGSTMSVFRNISTVGTTTFSPRKDIIPGGAIDHMYVGDLDGDGKPDLVYAGAFDKKFAVLRNTSTPGNISFAAPIVINDSSAPDGVVIADFDGDGKPDVAVSHQLNNTFAVFRNTTTGGTISFAAPVTVTSVNRDALGGIFAGDLDGDGKIDIVTTNQYSANQATITFKNSSTIGNISFAWVNVYTTGNHSANVIIADLDGDNKPDLAVPQGYSQFAVYKNTTVAGGVITFADPIGVTSGIYPSTIGIGDMDGDGQPDLAVPDGSFPGFIGVFKNTSTSGTPQFAAKVDYTKGTSSSGVQGTGDGGMAVADFDGDGRPDMVVSNWQGATISVSTNTLNAPAIASFSPASAITGSVVNITGTNLTGTTAVSFGGTSAASFTVNSPTSISAIVGTGASGSVSVTTPIATGVATGFVFLPSPTLTSFSPLAAAPGKTVTITGTNFTGATAVTFGGVNAASFSVVSATSITAVVDNSAASGGISVTTPAGVASLSGFTFAPAPTITSFAPATGAVGSVTVINGTNFNTTPGGNVVYFGAVKAIVNTATAQQLNVTVPAGASYQPISVYNTSSGLSGNSVVPFSTAFATKNSIAATDFDPKIDFTGANGIQATALSDIDGDGKADLIGVNFSANSFSVYRNTAVSGSITANSFAPKVDFGTGNGPQAIVVADIDGDGKPDIAVANFLDNTVSVYINTSTSGSISFSNKVDITTGVGPYAIAAGDIDGDGKMDIVVANATANTVSVLRNLSVKGSILFVQKVDFATGNAPHSVVVSDINGDGRPEILTANFTGNSFSLLQNTSVPGIINASSFAAHVDVSAGSGPQAIAVGDIDQNGLPDVIVANSKSNTVSVFRNTSSFSFAARVDLATGTAPQWVGMSDLDGDTRPDIISVNSTANTLSVFRNTMAIGGTPTASFAAKVDITLANTPSYASIGDVDGDGEPDLLIVNTGNSTFSVLRNNPAPVTAAAVPVITSLSPNNGAVGSTTTINGNNFNTSPTANIVYFGATKATVTSATATQLTVNVPAGATYQPVSVLNTSNSLTAYSPQPFNTTFTSKNKITTGDFSPKVDFATSSAPIKVKVCDIDGDGKPDVIVVNSTSNTISVYRNISTSGSITAASFAAKVDFTTNPSPLNIAIADLDGDGKPDIVVSNAIGNTISVFKNTAVSGSITTGSFAAKVDYTIGGNSYKIAIGDIDGDGKPDIVLGGSTLSILLNTTAPGVINTGSFAKSDFSFSVTALALADINNDGKIDILTGGNNTLTVITNNSTIGNLALAPGVNLSNTSQATPMDIAVADIDGDGKPDIIASNSAVYFYHNIFAGGAITTTSFEPAVSFPSSNTSGGPAGSSLVVTDMDGDGKPDLVDVNSGLNIASVFRNISTSATFPYSFFDAKVDLVSGTAPADVAVGDIDGDGKPDLVVVDQTANTFSVLKNNPVVSTPSAPPVISSIAPLTGPVGTVVTINGSNFGATVAGNMVYFGAVKAVVNSASATKLTVTVPVGATYEYPSVINTANALTGYAPVKFSTTFPSKNDITPQDFDPKVNVYNYGGNHVKIADIDGDGKPDLVFDDGNSVASVIRNVSTTGAITAASFGGAGNPTPYHFTTGTGILSLKVADIDGDGKPDILVTYYSFNGIGISVLINHSTPGFISFATKVDIAYNAVAFGANTYIVNVGDVDGDGKPDILIANSTLKGVSVLPNTSTPGVVSFGPRFDFEAGQQPSSVNLADIDGDGKPDLLVTNKQDNTISILRNITPQGVINAASFAKHVDYPTLNSPGYITVGDLNADGKPDIIVVGASSSGLDIFQNNSSAGVINASSLSSRIDLIPTSTAVGNVAEIADMDGDGYPDIVTEFSVVRNLTGAGTLSKSSFAISTLPQTSGNYFSWISVGDLDGDGKPDIAGTISGGIGILRNDPSTVGAPKLTSFSPTSAATGTTVTLTGVNFARVSSITIGGTAVTSYNIVSPTSITAVVGAGATGKIAIVTNTGKDTIAGFTYIPAPVITYPGPWLFAANAAITAIAPTNTGGQVASIYTISPALPAGLTMDPATGIISGTPLGASASTTYTVTASNGSGTSSPTLSIAVQLGAIPSRPVISSFSPASGPVGTTVTINGNNFNTTPANNIVYFGAVRATVTSASATQLKVTVPAGATFVPFTVINSVTNLSVNSAKPFGVTFASKPFAANNFDPRVDFPLSSYAASAVYLVDIDGDGKPDMLTTNSSNGTISIYRNISASGSITTGSFAPKVDFGTLGYAGSIAFADMDGDGKPDMFVNNGFYRNTSTPGSITSASFAPLVTLPIGGTPVLADVDGDGKTDLICINSTAAAIAIYRNISTPGSGITAASFAPEVDFKTPSLSFFTFADLDNDGKPEMIMPVYGGGLAVYHNQSTPGVISINSFASPVTYPAPDELSSIKVADIDGDGKPDLIASHYITSSGISILRNTSTTGVIDASSFAPNVEFATTVNPFTVGIADMDGDGKPDLITVTSQATTFYRNLASPGSFTTASLATPFDFLYPGGATSLDIGDVDGDGIPDLVSAFGGIYAYRNNANGNTQVSVSQLSPATGPVGTTITLTGNNFISVTGVSVGGVPTTNYNVDATNTTLTANVAAGSNGAVTVNTVLGNITYGNFSILNKPNISYTAPQSYVAGTAINPITPVNTGGAVPPTSYWVTSTFAGNGTSASVDGPALTASFKGANGIVADTLGNLYVSESPGQKIRKIAPDGTVSTFAGTGTAGAVNGPASSATFNGPVGLTIDKSGNLFVVDYNNLLIRKISKDGIVSTYAGSGQNGSTNGAAATASFNNPTGVAVDSLGNVYVADNYNNLIRAISPAGVVTTLAGGGNTYGGLINGNGATATFNNPGGIAMGPNGNILVADGGNSVIRRVTPAGYVSTFAGSGFLGSADGFASVASFGTAGKVYADQSGNVFLSDNSNNEIRQISPTGIVTTIAGTAPPINQNYPPSGPPKNGIGTAASFYYPSGITGNADGNLFVVDGGENLIRKMIYTGYTIKPALPAGLIFNTNTGVISGTPAGPLNPTTFTITANNEAGASKTTFVLKVVAPYPVITTSPKATNFVSTSNITPTPVPVDDQVTVTHALKTTLPSATVSITGGLAPAEDVLAFVNAPATMGNITGAYNAATGVLNLTSAGGTATIAQWQAALRAITYNNSKGSPTAGNRTISFTATDGTLSSPTVTKAINVKYNSDLNAISLSSGSLSPGFSADSLHYTSTVGNNVTTLNVTAQAADPASTLLINSVAVANGVSSGNINLNIGDNVISIVVTARDGVTKKTYSVVATRAKINQTITLAASNAVIYGTPDYSATSTNTSLPISYTSSNTSVATISAAGYIHVVGAGSAIITATQSGNGLYADAVPVTQALTVSPAALTITVYNQNKNYGSANPVLNASYTGLVNGDDATRLAVQPTLSTTATITSDVGTYPITVSGAASANYNITYVAATLTISPVTLTITADNQIRNFGAANPALTASYKGFVNNDDASKLSARPILSTTATTSSAAGSYPITASGASSANYTMVYVAGSLSVLPTPLISGISPLTAKAGTTVTITGSNFTGASAVSFGGTPAASFTVTSATTITAVVGAGASGNVLVSTPSGNSIFSGFNFVPVPTIVLNGSNVFIAGASTTLTANPGTGYTYQWIKDGVNITGATLASYTATQAGSYTVSITLNGISQTSAATLISTVFALPANNYTLAANSATCRGSANGTITITAAQSLSYTATITGGSVNATYPFTTNTTIANLAAGTYNVCFTVAGQSAYSQCFTVVITEPKDLAVYTAINKTINSVTLTLDGGNNYNVTLNGNTTTTTNSTITLNLAKGNNDITVTTDKPCQGSVTQHINLSADLVAYPNPFSSVLNVNLGTDNVPHAIIAIYSINGTQVYSHQFINQSGVVQLDLSALKPGLYILKLITAHSENIFKVMKQ